jgi:sn-glycerol 3-phosphate transport system ATP-binding protein
MGRAVVRDPKLFLFDEPLSNLDAKLRNQMRIEIKALQRRLGVTSIYVTHDQVEAMTMADRIIVLNEGRIEQIGTPSEIYHSPASTFVASFMGAPPMNLIRARIEGGQVMVNGSTNVMAVPAGWQGGDITLGIRPEDATLDPVGTVPFEVSIVEELGAHRLLHGQLADQPFTVHVSKEVEAQPGQTRLTLNPETLSLFDRESGKSL